jgi:hypothetical protein
VTPFEHLSVLISIIIGLGIAHLLFNVHRLVVARERVRGYWLAIVWVALVFTAQVQWWWSSFGFRDEVRWNFFYFLFILLSPVSLYLAAAFVLPDIERRRRYDLREYYYRNSRWFFAIMAMSPLLDAFRRGFEAGTAASFDVWSNAIAALMLASLTVSRSAVHHVLVTLTVTALFMAFIVSSAIELT